MGRNVRKDLVVGVSGVFLQGTGNEQSARADGNQVGEKCVV